MPLIRDTFTVENPSTRKDSWMASFPIVGLGSHESRVFSLSSIPWKIFIHTGINDADGLNELNPAFFKLGHSTTGEQSIGVWIHRSVPCQLVDVVAFHEVVEAELMLVYGVPRSYAHRVAFRLEQQYARSLFNDGDFINYEQFRSKVSDTSLPISEIHTANAA